MDAEIVDLPAAQVLGTTARINPMQADYRDLWDNGFGPREQEVSALATEPGYYGVYYGTGEENLVDLLAGMQVGDLTDVPAGLTLCPLPGGAYALFRCTLADLSATWGAIYSQWLPASSYVEDEARPCFEFFAPDAMGPDAPVRIYVPVKPK